MRQGPEHRQRTAKASCPSDVPEMIREASKEPHRRIHSNASWSPDKKLFDLFATSPKLSNCSSLLVRYGTAGSPEAKRLREQSTGFTASLSVTDCLRKLPCSFFVSETQPPAETLVLGKQTPEEASAVAKHVTPSHHTNKEHLEVSGLWRPASHLVRAETCRVALEARACSGPLNHDASLR